MMEVIKKIVLSLLHMFVGFSAVFGGIRLIVTNGMGMDPAWLLGSPFSDYLWPGFILAAVVGGLEIFAVLLIFINAGFYRWTSFTAGMSLVIWIFTQLYIMKMTSEFQIIFFFTGILIASVAFLPKQKKIEIPMI